MILTKNKILLFFVWENINENIFKNLTKYIFIIIFYFECK